KIPGFNREVRVPVTVAVGGRTEAGTIDTQTAPGYLRSSLLGVVFAAGWTPCVGPILGGIIGLASVSASVVQGTALLIAYALGLGIPFVLVAIGAGEMNGRLSWFRKHHAGVSLATGIMLVVVGFAMITDLMTKASSFMPNLGL
ncbi:MAG: cytochrome c biogenesis protein CcdA, partial [Actinomycetes bacterium]